MEKEQKTKLPEYGNEKYLFDLAWNDETKRDELVVIDAKPINEVMNARAKGTTVYDLINSYGGIDAVTSAFSERGVFADVSDVPEVCNNESYDAMIQRLQSQIDALKEQTGKTAVTDTATDTPVVKDDEVIKNEQ